MRNHATFFNFGDFVKNKGNFLTLAWCAIYEHYKREMLLVLAILLLQEIFRQEIFHQVRETRYGLKTFTNRLIRNIRKVRLLELLYITQLIATILI